MKYKGKIVHIDNTVICESPKLQKYTLKMREKLLKFWELIWPLFQ